ncbi:MAG: Lrp/AsnC ligand binding domain-containing protein [Candidatus Odinarchaeota archaeon]
MTAIILVMLDRVKRVWDLTAQELLSRRDELEIAEMHRIAGEYDVVIKLKTRNMETLEAILSKITTMKGVSRTHTLICLASYEHGYKIQSEENREGIFFPL